MVIHLCVFLAYSISQSRQKDMTASARKMNTGIRGIREYNGGQTCVSTPDWDYRQPPGPHTQVCPYDDLENLS